MRKMIGLLFALTIVVSACGQDNEVGGDLKVPVGVDPSECARLGQRCPPSPTAVASQAPLGGRESPSPPPPPPSPPAERPAITVTIPEGANYDPAQVEIQVGSIIEVVNKDCREDIPGRSYTATDRTFDSGLLKCGQVFRWKSNVIGEFQIEDTSGFPAVGKLTVTS